jgi:hypothetical protein
MSQKILLVSLIFMILFPTFLYSYNSLYISDPQSWRGGYGTIEDATISVKPQGLYMEIGLYLTISARGIDFYGQDQVEVDLDFTLPAGSIVKDSWLWVEDEIIRAEIMDKWTASQIYEDVVNRRRDPSILFKHSDIQYELRIYPLNPEKSRKVKLTYLVPAQWSGSEAFVPLPTQILRTSKYQLDNFQIMTWPDENWLNPRIVEMADMIFDTKIDPEIGEYFLQEIPPENYLNFAVETPAKDGIFLSTFDNGEESYYQLAFLPSAVLELGATKKVTILVDFDISKTNLEPSELIQLIKSGLMSYFDEDDYFNLIFANLNTSRIRDSWISAHPDTIEHIFASIDENLISGYSNLPSLLADGIEFLKENGNNGAIMLLSSSDQFGDFESANQLIGDIMDLMEPVNQIHIGDLQSINFSYHWINGRTYNGNAYLYENLSRLTTANLNRKLYETDFSQVINKTFQGLGKLLPVFELHTTVKTGICYGRMNLEKNLAPTYLNTPILQVGKFDGDVPFFIEASGIYENEIFSQTFGITPENIVPGDSVLRTIWAANLMQSFDYESQTNEVVGQIIDMSIKERILSNYTAFICLEPSMGGQVCYDCFDESELVSVEEEENSALSDSSLINVYPNPFNDQTKIQIKLAGLENANSVDLKIYNILGELIKDFELSNSLTGNQIEITWNGKNNSGVSVASGTYILVLSTPIERKTHKLLFMK